MCHCGSMRCTLQKPVLSIESGYTCGAQRTAVHRAQVECCVVRQQVVDKTQKLVTPMNANSCPSTGVVSCKRTRSEVRLPGWQAKSTGQRCQPLDLTTFKRASPFEHNCANTVRARSGRDCCKTCQACLVSQLITYRPKRNCDQSMASVQLGTAVAYSLVFAIALLVRFLVSLHPYSGMKRAESSSALQFSKHMHSLWVTKQAKHKHTGICSSGAQVAPKYGDYEAQRHWMEVTVNLPPSEW